MNYFSKSVISFKNAKYLFRAGGKGMQSKITPKPKRTLTTPVEIANLPMANPRYAK
jgi:hypothetical protein